MEADLGHLSLSRQVEMGRQVEAMLESSAFADLCEVLRIHREGLTTVLLHQIKPGSDAASYADVVGHLRGLSEIEPLARGIVENGKQAAGELRAKEEESP